MDTRRTAVAAVSLSAMALLSACANQTTMTESHFGDSVRQMVRAQTFDPSTLETPALDPIDSTDGALLEGVIDVYRSDVGQPDQVSNDIVINVGGQ